MSLRECHRLPVRRRLVLRPLFLSWLALVCGSSLFALDSTRAVTTYVHDVWDIDRGLPQNSVTTILQTRAGYLWIGTQQGLVRYDGARFVTFDEANTPLLRNSFITDLAEAPDGTLWIATRGGVVVFRDGALAAAPIAARPALEFVRAVEIDRRGAVWIGARDGLYRSERGAMQRVTTAAGLNSDRIRSILADRQGRVWIGTDAGLNQFAGGSFVHDAITGAFREQVNAIVQDHAGNLWIGTDGGLRKIVNGTVIVPPGPALPVSAIMEDRDRNVWVATSQGLFRVAGGTLSRFGSADGLSNDTVFALAEDREGSLWIGTDGGLNRLKDSSFVTHAAADGLAGDMITSIAEDAGGALWIATAEGLTRAKDGAFTTLRKENGLSSNLVYSLLGDGEGRMFVGTRKGLQVIEGSAIRPFPDARGSALESIMALALGPDGSLWIGTRRGLKRWKSGQLREYGRAEGLSSDDIFAVRALPGGDVWIGTNGGGLNRLRDGRVDVYRAGDGLGSDVVHSITQDPKEGFWIGTRGGLVRYANGRFSRVTVAEGLFDNVIWQVLEANGSLWMSSNKGVFRVPKQDVLDLLDGRRTSIATVAYGTADGMKSRECNGGFQPAGWKARDGRLWFPTIRGAAVVDPGRLRVNRLPPPVVLEEVRIDGTATGRAAAIDVPPDTATLEFHYTALSLVAPERVRFRYRLEGYDADWIDAGSRRTAYYTRVRPGKYRFHVTAANNDGVWNQSGAAIPLRVLPRFHQTLAFQVLLTLAVAVAIWLLHRYRLAQERARFVAVAGERNRISREIHDTLAQGFAAISMQLEVASKMSSTAPERATEHIRNAKELVRSSLAEARRSMWALREPARNDSDLAAALIDVARSATRGSTLQFGFRSLGPARPLPAHARDHLLRIAQEATTNVIRHAGARRLSIELEYGRRELTLIVRDDGLGIDPAAQPATGDHLGIIGMRERTAELGGTLRIDSRAGEGTAVVVTVPLPRRRLIGG
jgi:ligand-binding sensor domain-containing protein/signal transduction histidine kinase